MELLEEKKVVSNDIPSESTHARKEEIDLGWGKM
jgi:hypothetical protein